MSILRIGDGKDFGTIGAGISAATEGDILLIDPGDYTNEGQLSVTKPIHLVGNTSFVYDNPIKLKTIYYNITNNTKINTILCENLYFYYDIAYSYRYLIRFNYTGPSETFLFLVNKCAFVKDPGDNYYYFIYDESPSIIFISCFIKEKYESGDNGYVSVIRTETTTTNNTLHYYDDYVLSPTEGYGPAYGHRYFKLPTKHYFEGVVTVTGVPTSRRLKAYRQDNDVLVGFATSDQTTGYFKLLTEYEGEHYIVCKDSKETPYYNDLVRGRVFPAIAEFETNYWQDKKYLEITISGAPFTSSAYNIPVLVKFKQGSGLNAFDTSIIFDELLDQTHSTRISLQTTDGQQCFCEVVYWNNQDREGFLYFQIPYFNNTIDNVFYLYYDTYMPDNIFNVGYSSNIMVSHLWGRTALGIWHMNERPDVNTNIVSSTYKKFLTTPVNLYPTDRVQAPLGYALKLTNGYLDIDSTISDQFTKNFTIMAYAKLDSFTTTSTFFSIGSAEAGLEFTVTSGVLYLALSTQSITGRYAAVTLSGLSLNNWYLFTGVVDSATAKISIYIDDNLMSQKTFDVNNFLYNDSRYSIGTNYKNSPLFVREYLVSGVHKVNKEAISLTSSGTVASGTCMLLVSDGVDYFDDTGRHTYTVKNPISLYVSQRANKTYKDFTITTKFGSKDSDPINAYSYTKINSNLEDFGFDADQDFTISSWVHTYYGFTGINTDNFFTLIGDVTGSRNTCLSLTQKQDLYYYYGWKQAIEWHVTIPNDSGGFVVSDVAVDRHLIGDYVWQHVALVRHNGTILLFVDGQQKYSVYYNGKIPSPVDLGVSPGIAVCSISDQSLDGNLVYMSIDFLEVLKGKARWQNNFDVGFLKKEEPTTFFDGQIDEFMLYNEVKTDNFIKLVSRSMQDRLLLYGKNN